MINKQKYKENIGNDAKHTIRINLCEEDSTPNAYAVHCLWYFIIALLLFVVLQLLRICIVDNSLAMPGLLGATLVLLIAEAFGHFVDHTKSWLKYLLVTLSVLAVTISGIYLTYHTTLTSVVPLLIAAQYSKKRVIIFSYILSLISIFVIVLLGYTYGLSDANMVIQTVSKSSVYGEFLSSEVQPLSQNWFSVILFFAIPRCLIISAFVPMINAIVKNRQEIMLRDVELKYMGEHDQMTGFFNREKYASMLNESYTKLHQIAILYFDLNNLKFVNDTYGHHVGDNLIKRASDSIHSALKDNMDAYRLGGDEFMIVIPNGKPDDVASFVLNWQQNLDIINSLPGAVECQIAYGYAFGEGKDFLDVLKHADKNMYENKSKCKTQQMN